MPRLFLRHRVTARVLAGGVWHRHAHPRRGVANSTSLDDLIRLIKHPSIEYRPELRWWLAEGLYTDETLRYEIDTAQRPGFGGMEFLAMDEGNIDHARYGWGAEEWVHDSQTVVEDTTRRNLSVSFTSATAWANANLRHGGQAGGGDPGRRLRRRPHRSGAG